MEYIVEQLYEWVGIAFAMAVLGILVSLPFAVATTRKQAEEQPIDWGQWQDAKYRNEAIQRNEIAQTVRITRLNDQRRRTKDNAQVLQLKTMEPIAVIPDATQTWNNGEQK